jgi:hypothetical protein
VRRRESTIAGILTSSHPVREDLLDDPRQSDHADHIGGSDSANITAEDGLEDIGDQVQARWRREFRIPSGKVVIAVSLCLWDVEDFVLERSRKIRDELLPEVFSGEDTYKIWLRDDLFYRTSPPGERDAQEDVAACKEAGHDGSMHMQFLGWARK